MLGDVHQSVANILSNLAYVYSSQGRHHEAECQYLEALIIMKRLPDEHPSTATYLDNLATLYAEQTDYKLAMSLYEQALEIRTRLLGESHPDTKSSANSLAAVKAKLL